MQVLIQRWACLRWPERLASVLAFTCLLALGLGGIVHLISTTVVGYDLIFAAFCLLAATSLIYFTFGSSGLTTVKWTRWLALAGTLALVASLALSAIPAAQPLAWLAGQITFILWILAYLVYVLRTAVRGIRFFTGAGVMMASLVALLFIIFTFAFSSFLVFLVSNGDTGAFTLADPASWSHPSGLRVLESIAIGIVAALLVVLPELAYRALPWHDTSKLTRSRITRWLSMGAALFTGLFVFMFHFQAGPLAHVSLGQLVVGVLFAVALLIPIYRSVVGAFWEWGVLHLIDLGRWRTDWHKVLKETRAGLTRLSAELDASLDSKEANQSDSQHANEGPSMSKLEGSGPVSELKQRGVMRSEQP